MIINKTRVKSAKDDWSEQKTSGVPRPKLYETKGRETGLCEPVDHLLLVPCFGVLRHDALSHKSNVTL